MRKIIHIDMDCFYAAIEMRDNPAYRLIPLAVGGDVKQRGVIATANYIARRYGVHSAMSTAKALTLCPYLKVVPGRMSVYKEVSNQIRNIFFRYTDRVEFLSIDEAYLDVTRSTALQGSATRIAHEIRCTIQKELQLTASAGIAPLKYLAKIASDMNKPNGQYVITPDIVANFLAKLPLNKISGVGKATEKKLAELGLFCCQDIIQYDLRLFLQQFGKFGKVLYERSLGIDDREINNDRQRKSIGVEKTLPYNLRHWSHCIPILETLYIELEWRLRQIKPELTIARQGVKFKFDDFQLTTQEHVWPKLDHNDLVQLANQLWFERRKDRAVRLIGLHASLMEPQLEKQFNFNFKG